MASGLQYGVGELTQPNLIPRLQLQQSAATSAGPSSSIHSTRGMESPRMDQSKFLAKTSAFDTPQFGKGDKLSDAESRVSAQAPVPNNEYAAESGSLKFYALCGIGGAASCGITHLAIVPLDLVKCRMQVDPGKYSSLGAAFKLTLQEQNLKGLVRGWSPTVIGYSIQGFTRFGLYEVFKSVYASALGEERAYTYRTLTYLAAAATAECIADIPLSPFESMKVRMQTQNNFTSKMREGVPEVYAKEGIYGFFKSIVPLWGRQIPYTMVKFSCFENTVELLYKYVVPKPRDQSTKGEQLVVTFAAGYIAGVFCAIVSHPADTLVSKLQVAGTTVSSVYKAIGFSGLWSGFGPRVMMIGTLAASQWFIYDGAKVAFRLPRPPPPEMPANLRAKLQGAGAMMNSYS